MRGLESPTAPILLLEEEEGTEDGTKEGASADMAIGALVTFVGFVAFDGPDASGKEGWSAARRLGGVEPRIILDTGYWVLVRDTRYEIRDGRSWMFGGGDEC